MQFYIVATPIGNLADITLRAVEVLKQVDFIVCEDTRVSRRLLEHYAISKRLISFHQHSPMTAVRQVYELLSTGKTAAYLTDAGTPGISDPGGLLVSELLRLSQGQVSVIPLPGASAVLAALSVSGFPADSFCFRGFIPHKKGRQTFLDMLVTAPQTTVFYESVHRIDKLLSELVRVMPQRPLMIARELTKKFETIYRGRAEEIAQILKRDKVKGEFVIVIPSKKYESS